MPNFAVHDGSCITNVVVAESVEIAEMLTGLSAFETNGEPWIDWTLEDGVWVAPPIEQPNEEVVEEAE